MDRAGSQASSPLQEEQSDSSGAVPATWRSISVFISGSLSSPKSLTSASELPLARGPGRFYFQHLPLVSPARFWATLSTAIPLSPSDVYSQTALLCGSWSHRTMSIPVHIPATSWAAGNSSVEALPFIKAPNHSGQVGPGSHGFTHRASCGPVIHSKTIQQRLVLRKPLRSEGSCTAHSGEGAHKDRSVPERTFTGALKDAVQWTSPAVVKWGLLSFLRLHPASLPTLSCPFHSLSQFTPRWQPLSSPLASAVADFQLGQRSFYGPEVPVHHLLFPSEL